MDMQKKQPENTSIVFYWVENLVGTGPRFLFNMLLSVFGGLMYSVGTWDYPIMLAIFGVLSPLIFTLCLYSLIRSMLESPDNPFPKVFRSQRSNSAFMFLDMLIIIGMAILIQTNIIDYLFFRILQTIIFPALLVFMLRVLYVNIGNDGGDTDKMN